MLIKYPILLKHKLQNVRTVAVNFKTFYNLMLIPAKLIAFKIFSSIFLRVEKNQSIIPLMYYTKIKKCIIAQNKCF
jgi:hypothetical protein